MDLMKNTLYLILLLLSCGNAFLKAQDREKALRLIERAQRELFSNPKQASYDAGLAAAQFPENKPDTMRAHAMLLWKARRNSCWATST